jgi:hypothetical protein
MSWFALFNVCSCCTYQLAKLEPANSASCNGKSSPF